MGNPDLIKAAFSICATGLISSGLHTVHLRSYMTCASQLLSSKYAGDGYVDCRIEREGGRGEAGEGEEERERGKRWTGRKEGEEAREREGEGEGERRRAKREGKGSET